jgi:transmembrane sensor
MEDKLRRIPPHALPVLAQSGKDGRRKALRALGFVAMAGGTAYVLRNTSAWQAALADYSTATGEIRHVTLSDGTRLTLDTASAVDVRFDAVARLVALRSGTLLASTAPHPDKGGPGGAARPFLVQSPQGTVRALGTRFTVSRDGPVSHVAVYQGAVEIQPHDRQASAVRLEAGQKTSFSDKHVQPPRAADESDAAWAQGLLVAEHMRVQDFAGTLGRYRSGILRCDPLAADLRISGVFSLTDTDRALESLALALPVTVAYRTRYWVTILPR